MLIIFKKEMNVLETSHILTKVKRIRLEKGMTQRGISKCN